MNDFIALLIVATAAIAGGIYLIRQAKAYRQRVDTKRASVWDQPD